ncbi:hypothetical protein EK21DRAFT_77094 [Setomelanomma holmii]|uniref:BAHD acyltransferase n=1 Tax=Setomelanomma holmii TaxID=210430 RepID=A0A9P4LH76_9PLEO|nr:hypothetical protein EK21DRAFT_77094 [Setomelanomma holmii]
MAANSILNAKELHIHPSGWQSNPETERFAISLLGHLMPKVYVQVVEVFSLPENTNVDATIKNMVAGLEFALSQYQVLTGVLRTDDANGEMWVEKRRSSTVSLHIKHMVDGDEFPSYEELERKDFPANLLVGHKLIPESAAKKQLYSPLGANDEADISMATFQLNFIRGGFVLGLAVHHALSDVTGCDGFLTIWAKNSTAAAHGEPFVAVEEPFTLEGSILDVQRPDLETAKKLENAYPLVKIGSGAAPPPPADFQMPAIACEMFHFPRSKAEALKDQVSKELREGWISTYDAFMALLWGRVTLARLPLLQPDLDSDVIFVHAMNTRKCWKPPLPESFLGNGAWGARCEPLLIKEVIAPENLPRLAKSVRASIQQLTLEHLTGLLQWTANVNDKRYFEFRHRAFMGMDFGGTSWAGMKAYEKHDFGFGCPKALRWPSPQHDGYVFVYPSRASQKAASEDEGIEVCVCLEQSCMERLLKDELLRSYAQPRS